MSASSRTRTCALLLAVVVAPVTHADAAVEAGAQVGSTVQTATWAAVATPAVAAPWGTGAFQAVLPSEAEAGVPLYLNVANAGTTRLVAVAYRLSSVPELPVALEGCTGDWDESDHSCSGAVVEVLRTSEQAPSTYGRSAFVPQEVGSVVRVRLRPLTEDATVFDVVALDVGVDAPAAPGEAERHPSSA